MVIIVDLRDMLFIITPSLNDDFEIKKWTQETILQKCKGTNIFMEKNYLCYKNMCFTATHWKKCFITSDISNFLLIFPLKNLFHYIIVMWVYSKMSQLHNMKVIFSKKTTWHHLLFHRIWKKAIASVINHAYKIDYIWLTFWHLFHCLKSANLKTYTEILVSPDT